MNRLFFLIFFFVWLSKMSVSGQDSISGRLWSLEASLHYAHVVENYSAVPKSANPYFVEFNTAIQTDGSRDWHHSLGLPKFGVSVIAGNLGNRNQLGYMLGAFPNLTFNTANNRWYSPRISLGLGLAYFTKKYSITDTLNYYIGSHITALAHAAVYVQPQLSRHLEMKAGIAVFHASNGHYQVPNLGINLPTLFVGLVYHPQAFPKHFERRQIETLPSKLKFNMRVGLGVHELARTLGPVGTAKYAIYVTDFYLSRRYGKVSNVQAGLEINHYNSYYNYIVKNNFFEGQQKLKASVFTAFLAHELLIGRFSLLTQGGINVYNRFYDQYILMYKSEQGIKSDLKKYISTRLGIQYYFWNTPSSSKSKLFVGTYIKANFGQADFICTQLGIEF